MFIIGENLKKKLLIIKILPIVLTIIFLNQIINQNVAKSDFSKEDISPYGQIIFLNADSHYNYGLKAGKEFRLQYKILDILAGFKINKQVEKEYNYELNSIEQNYPFFLEELKGLSSSLNIKVERLLFIRTFLSNIFDGECTTTLSTGIATKDNQTFLTQTIDSKFVKPLPYIRLFLFRILYTLRFKVHNVDSGYKYVFLGIPILKEYPIINEKGLGFGGNGNKLTTDPNRIIDEGDGIPPYLINRLVMMNCKNVKEAAEFWNESERSSDKTKKGFHFCDFGTASYCDRNGGIVTIEQTHSYFISVFGNSTDITNASLDILWHGNHHQFLDPNKTGSANISEYPSSALRAQRAHEILEKNYGNITLDICKEITKDHGGGTNPNGPDSSDICRHPDVNDSGITAFSWIVQPKQFTVYWTHGSPCKSKFWKHDFSKMFT